MSKSDPLIEEIYISEAYLVALLWNDPDLYGVYQDKLNTKTFGNPIWSFYYGLGKHMFDKKVFVFDDISSFKSVQDVKGEAQYYKYGGYDTIDEIVLEVKNKEDNFDGYYGEVKKYRLLRDLRDLLGDKVTETNGKYDYHKMTAEQLITFWNDKMNRVSLNVDTKFDEHFLLKDIDKAIEQWDTNPNVGLPFYDSKLMTKVTTGFDYGNVYIYGGFGGSGKTAFTFNKVIMSCIENQEELLVIANEQSLTEFQKILAVTVMGNEVKEGFQRQRLNEGNFKEEEKDKLNKTVKRIQEMVNDEKLIKFVFLQSYTIENVKKLVTYYANRGVRRVIIDTGKPSDDAGNMPRWERFAEDFKEIYKLARPDGGGKNLAVWVNVQLSDSALGRRFLDEYALGDSKKLKNEASVLFLGRSMWDDEYTGGKHELDGYKYVKAPVGGYGTHEFKFDRYEMDNQGQKRENSFFLLFCSKNRRGQDNKTGLDVLVFKRNLNNNTWHEVGWTKVFNDRNY